MSMRILKLTLAYDGTDFHGWQAQPGLRTVQGVLADACARVLRHPCLPTGAGRTDAGVHALGQVASLETTSPKPAGRLLAAIDGCLPEDVAVRALEEAPEGFSARFSARSKWYRYRILDARARDPLERRFCLHVPAPLDAERMREAARALVGTHDFRSFAKVQARSARADAGAEESAAERSTVRTLYSVDVTRVGTIMALDVRGDGFLYNMVRAIAGTLIEVGRGRRPPGFAGEALRARDRRAAGPTAPPQGLFLMEVTY